MKITTTLFALSAIVLSAGVASAQQFYAQRAPQNSIPVFQSHSSTLAEGVLRGSADLTRAAGDYNYNTSLALINREIARDLYMDNQVKSVNTYFELKRINKESRDYNNPRPTAQDVVRYSQDRAPERLGSHQYEPVLGKLFWPGTLNGDEFAAERETLNTVFMKRVGSNSGLTSDSYSVIKTNVASMEQKLLAQIDLMSPAEYAAAKSFLAGLDYEAQLVATPAGVAVR